MSFKDVLRIRSFRNLWLGQAISQLGDSIYYVAFMFMAQQVTGSFAMVGYVGAMEMLPYLLVGPSAGVIADRFDRRKIMFLSDIGSAATLLAFAAMVAKTGGKPPAWALLCIPFGLSTMRCFFNPAKTASIPNLVPSELLNLANAVSNGTFNVVGLIGLSVAATVVSALYAVSPASFLQTLLVLNALSFAGSAFFVARLPAIVPDREHQEDKHPLEDFKAGVRFVAKRHDLKMLIVLLTVFRLGVAPFFVAYVAANKQWFGGKPQTLMWFEFAFFAGMIVGSVIAAKMKVRRPTMLFSLELGLIGVLIVGMSIRNIDLFVGLNFVCGIVVAAGDIPITTYLQASVADGFRGRVNAVKEMIATGVMPIGMALGGIMLRSYGLTGSFFIMGTVMAIAGFAGFLDRRYRSVLMPEEVLARKARLPEGVVA